MMIFITIIITVAILVGQTFLSKRKSAAWGGILPAAALGLGIWIVFLQPEGFNRSMVLPSIVLVTILCSIWEKERTKLKKNAEKQAADELQKMKAKDL